MTRGMIMLEDENFFMNLDKCIKTFNKINIKTSYHNEFERKKYTKYARDRLVIGKKKYNFSKFLPLPLKSELKLEMEQSLRMLIIGKTGSGKSFLVRSIFNRFFKANGLVVVVSDVKGEYSSSIFPLQKKFHTFLRRTPEGETIEYPEGFPIVEYIPAFLTKKNKKLKEKENIKLFQFRLTDISSEDLIKLSPKSISQAQEKLINKYLPKSRTISEFRDHLFHSNEISSTVKNLLIFLDYLEVNEIIGNSYSNIDNIVNDLKQKKIPILNLFNYEEISKHITQCYVGFVLKKINYFKKNEIIGKSKRLLLVLDEIADFCPSHKLTPSREEIENLLRKSRVWNISLLMSTQSLHHISEELFRQTDTFFVSPATIPKDQMKSILNMILPELNQNPYYFNKNVSKILKKEYVISRGNRIWFYFYTGTSRKIFVSFCPYAPLSEHFEEF